MADHANRTDSARLAFPVLAALALAACGSAEEAEPAYEAGVEDASGGELIVTDPEDPRIEDLELPETRMTPVPDAAASPPATVTSPPATPSPAPPPAE